MKIMQRAARYWDVLSDEQRSSPTEIHTKAMKKAGIEFPFLWAILQDFPTCMIIKNRITGEFRMVEKYER